MQELAGTVALVTGGARGIGAAVARLLAEEGADVAIADARPGDEAEALASRIISSGRRCVVLTTDVADVRQCELAVADVVESLGRLDIVVNNAGGAFGDYTTFEDVSEAQFDRIIDVNLKGTFFVSKFAVPHLRAGGRGRIINISSELVYIGYELTSAYTAAKGGVVALTKSMARALAPDIRVNAVAPGPTATERFKTERWYTEERRADIPLGRFGEPEDVARSVVFLAGQGGDHYTGQTLDVNGGFVMR
jgi:NAD(P)-dependent dehydrogenase (short-subunit alcohol dehydrogenase family)